MALHLSTADLVRAGAQHPWLTIGGWLALLVAAIVLIATLLDGALTTDQTGTRTNNPESVRAGHGLHQTPHLDSKTGPMVVR
jgi:uncharacterized membrane protein YdfJ with MMPL/SSD domain